MRRVALGLILVALVGYALCLALPPIWDSDVWWHLRVGEWIAHHHALPHRDLFSSVNPERPWRSFNWLFQLGVYGIYRASGLFGLRLFAAAVTLAGYALWLRFFHDETRSWPLSLALALLLVLLFDDRIRVRPHLFNLAGDAAVALFCAGAMTLGTRARRTGFFALFYLWANLHDPGAMFGALVIGAAAVGRLALARGRGEALGSRVRELAWPVGLAALAVVATPYGPALVLAARDNITPVRMGIGEWQPVLTYLERSGGLHHVICALVPFGALLAIVAVVATRLLRGRLRNSEAWLGRAAAPIAFAATSLVAMRFVYLAVAPLAWLLGAVDWSKRRRLALGLAALSILALGRASFEYSVLTGHGSTAGLWRDLAVNVKPAQYPESAAALLGETRAPGRVFTLSNWGGYLLWFGRPPSGVATDGRYNLDARTLALLHEIETARGQDGARIDHALRALGMDLAVLPSGAFPFDEHPGWIRVAHDEVSETFLRDGDEVDRAAVAALERPAAGESLEEAATRFFGERYRLAHPRERAALEARHDHAGLHELARMEVLAGRDAQAIALLEAHLGAQPACLQARFELARILHRRGRVAEAWALVRPLARATALPISLAVWVIHLHDEASR
ncbi:MAG TPA: hypothetical protein VII38_00545 [Polyangia bacterium]